MLLKMTKPQNNIKCITKIKMKTEHVKIKSDSTSGWAAKQHGRLSCELP